MIVTVRGLVQNAFWKILDSFFLREGYNVRIHLGANLRESFGKPTACWDSIYKNTVEAPIYRHAPHVKRELHVGWNVQRGRYQPGMLQGWMRTGHEVPGRLGEGDLLA